MQQKESTLFKGVMHTLRTGVPGAIQSCRVGIPDAIRSIASLPYDLFRSKKESKKD